MAVAVLFTTSCAKEDISSSIANGETVEITFTANLPELGTRTYGDGTKADILYYNVYEAGTDNQLVNLCGTATSDNGTFTFSLDMVKGMKYDIALWAQDSECHYYSLNGKNITVSYNGKNANDDTRDAFYKFVENFDPTVPSEVIPLTRPFAQLNAATNDIEAVANSGVILTTSTVTVDTYTGFNIATGDVTGNKSTVTFAATDIPTEDLVGKENYTYLSMNYILVPKTGMVTNTTFEFKGTKSSGTEITFTGTSYSNVPLKQNFRTNILGALLTKPTDFEVEIVADFSEPDTDIDVWDGKTVTEPTYNTQTETYTVDSGSDLAWLAGIVNGTLPESRTVTQDDFAGKTFVLTKDIDLNGKEWTPISMSTNLAGGETFRGTFDGQGHTIYGLTVNQKDAAGLFGYIYAATIKNVTVNGASINSNHYAGGIVAWILNTKGNIQVPAIIENCHVVNSTITSAAEELVNGEWDNGDKVGGLVGYACFGDANYPTINNGAGIKNCSVENTTVKAYRDFGGLVGYASYVAIENCSVENVTLEQDLTHDYKAPNTPTTYGELIGRNDGGNTIDGNDYNNYVTYGVSKDTEGNYHIYNAAGLQWVTEQVNTMEYYVNQAANIFDGKTVYIENNIDLGGAEWRPIGDYAFSRTSFNGVFDGKNHTISNFKVTEPVEWTEKVSEASYGFFGNVKGTIKNLTIENATVIPEGGRYSAALVGRLHNGGRVENCHVVNSSATISHWQVGGLVGQNNNGNISGCSVVGSTITGKAAVGAIVGMDMTAGEHTIENCRVANTALVQNASFGASYDASYGLAVGLVNASGIILHLNDIVVENNTIKDVASDVLIGDIEAGATININDVTIITTAEQLAAALKAGGKCVLASDIVMTNALSKSNANFSLNGNGYTISMAEDCTNTYAMFDITGGKIAFENVVFDGIKDGAVVRTVGVEFTADNVTAQNGNHTQQQGLFRLMGKSTITNCTFKNNTCSMVITLNYDGANNDPQVVENCVFEGNNANATAVLYYVKGASCTLNNNKFVGNTVNCSGNGATVYMGFQENCSVTNNIFKNNTVNEAGDSSRVAGGIFFGYDMEFTGNAFIGNKVTGTNAKGNDVCVSTYYTDINLSGNYWGGKAPVEDVNYFVQHKTSGNKVIVNDYLSSYAE